MIDMAQRKGTSLIAYSDNYQTTKKKRTLVALKSYPMSPFTTNKHIDKLFKNICKAIDLNK